MEVQERPRNVIRHVVLKMVTYGSFNNQPWKGKRPTGPISSTVELQAKIQFWEEGIILSSCVPTAELQWIPTNPWSHKVVKVSESQNKISTRKNKVYILAASKVFIPIF